MSFSVIAILIFGASYAAKQSNHHRRNEQRATWFALETKAIDPYLASMNEEDRNELKKKLTEKLFGQINDTSGIHESKSGNKNILEHLQIITELIKNLTKSSK